MSDLKCCPSCKSTMGYQYKHTVEYLQANDFNNNAIFAENTGNGKELKTKRCIECDYNLTKELTNSLDKNEGEI